MIHETRILELQCTGSSDSSGLYSSGVLLGCLQSKSLSHLIYLAFDIGDIVGTLFLSIVNFLQYFVA
jgi:hypothetical protein